MNITNSIIRMWICACGLTAFQTSASPRSEEPYPAANTPAAKVDPFIGASTSTALAGTYHGLGKTFPGATTPFGMVQISPNTITGGDNGSGYSYEHKTIEGFALTQMSGVGWYGDLGNFLIMPTTGQFHSIAGKEDGRISGYRSAYDKESETAHPGYYKVRLTDYDITAETTATPHCGVARFTFPKADTARIQIDLARRVGGTAVMQHVKVINDSTLAGWIHCTPQGGGWGNGGGKVDYKLFFYSRLSRPMKTIKFWKADIPENAVRRLEEVNSTDYLNIVRQAEIIDNVMELTGKHIGFFMEFPSEDGEQVEIKTAISFVDSEGALNNYMMEADGKNFSDIHRKAIDMWNNALGKIKVKGGSGDEHTAFYTALYHTMIDPRICSDTDGRYIGADHKIHTNTAGHARRTIFSGWDVFRSQFPLQNIINPELVSDEINSLIDMAEESGNFYYPRWELLNAYSGCMIGNPAIPVIADAYAKGIRTFDADKALRYAINTSDKFGTSRLGYAPDPNSISCTLEYAYDDWCVSKLAEACGNDSVAMDFRKRAQAYRNVFDPTIGWFRPKNSDGTWAEWNEADNPRLREGFGCIESNPYQQGWFVPHDVEGIASLMGGMKAAVADLDYMFAHTPDDMKWNAYYNHANEPVHFVPYLYNCLGAPWKTQEQTRRICRSAYGVGAEGLVGNEDVGQMSAWYVLSSTGIHPSCPGDTKLQITSPVFDEVEYQLDEKYHTGGTFKIIAHDNSDNNVYIDRALLNGKPYNKCAIDFSDIGSGSTLELFMSSTPNKHWGTE